MIVALFALAVSLARVDSTIAIVGATVIDGNGGAPVPNAVVVVIGKKITAVGPRASIKIPPGARIIDGTGKYLIPGLVDTNVHISLYNCGDDMIRYESRFTDIVVEAAQINLKHGVTTVRDSYGMLKPLLAARDAINKGDVIGPRLYVAGNIVGWGSCGSFTFEGNFGGNRPKSFFEERMADAMTEGSGEELLNVEPDSLRVLINKYLDKGVDFLKYGGTTHAFFPPALTFSERAAKAIVEEVHKRKLVAETHATSPEGARIAIMAGIDLMQHPEFVGADFPADLPDPLNVVAPMSDSLVRLFVERKVVCSIMPGWVTGKHWERSRTTLIAADSAARKKADSLAKLPAHLLRAQTTAERQAANFWEKRTAWARANAQKLIRAGCIISVATDQLGGGAPEFQRAAYTTEDSFTDLGAATWKGIEGLVDLGMTPLQALTAATKNGAIASKALDKYGTIEVGKFADILLLDADPTANIKNIRTISMVMKEGRVIDTSKLPTNPVFTGRAVLTPNR
jgi:imidazolonepropionase-like amidohydrolase